MAFSNLMTFWGPMQVRAQDTPLVILRVAQRGGASLQAAWTFLRMCGISATYLFNPATHFHAPLG